MTIQLTIYMSNDYRIEYIQMTIQFTIYGQMTIQLTIYIVKWLDNCTYSNDYKIDNILSQMTIQLTIYIVKWL